MHVNDVFNALVGVGKHSVFPAIVEVSCGCKDDIRRMLSIGFCVDGLEKWSLMYRLPCMSNSR